MGTIKGNGSNGPAPFLTKTYEMVDDPLTNSMVSWSHIGCSFVVWKPTEFTQYLLPNYFKHSNFSSFVRQLNTYGFRKIHPDQWEFANADFIRGQKSLLMNIQRRKPIHSHSVQGQENISPLTGTERQEFEDEIKQLKYDKAVLESKLKSHGRDKHGFELQTQSLLERLQSVERRQMQLMPFLAQLINKPGLASILIEQLQSDNKKRRISKSDCFRGEQGVEGDQSSPDRFPAPLVNFELIEKSDRSLRFWENVLYEVGGNVGQEASSFGTWSQRSSNNVGKSNASCGDSEHFSSVSHPSSRNSGDVLSSSGLVGCANDAGRPTFSTRHPGGNIRPESPDFDGNFKSGDEEIKEPASETTNPTMVAGANDQFWQYFLTEAPGSSATPEPEHHGERRSTTSGRTSEMMLNSDGRPWWNANCIDNLTKNTGRIVTADTTGSWFCCMTLIGSKLLWSCWPLALTFGIPPAVDGDRHVLHAHLMRNFETFSYSFEIKKGNVLKERANARVDHEISV